MFLTGKNNRHQQQAVINPNQKTHQMLSWKWKRKNFRQRRNSMTIHHQNQHHRYRIGNGIGNGRKY